MAGRRAKALKEVTGTERRSYNIDARLNRILGAYAKFHGMRESEVVNAALVHHLRGFSVSTAGADTSKMPDRGPEVTTPLPRQEELA